MSRSDTPQPMPRDEHMRSALEQASLSAVGALGTASDDSWLHAHLDEGCEVCSEAVIRVSMLFDQLLLAAPPVRPARSVRDRIQARIARTRGGSDDAAPENDIRSQIWKQWVNTDGSGLRILRENDTEWEDTEFEGVAVRRLHVDEDQNRVTMLVRMAAGTSYPAHRHGGDEHCLVLEGDLAVGDELLEQGDYQMAPEGSVHGVQSTPSGCLLLIVSSTDDEILAG